MNFEFEDFDNFEMPDFSDINSLQEVIQNKKA